MRPAEQTGSDAAPEVILSLGGLHCASCVGRVEQALRAVPGVEEAKVNLASSRAFVRIAGGDAGIAVRAVREAGFEAEPLLDTPEHAAREARARADESRRLLRAFLLAAALTLPVFLLEMGSHLVPGMAAALAETPGTRPLHLLYFVLATAVQFGPGLRFYRTGWPPLLRGTPDMNSLVMLGSSAAWGYSVVAVFFASLLPAGTANVYFEASAVIITLILGGRYLEARGRRDQAPGVAAAAPRPRQAQWPGTGDPCRARAARRAGAAASGRTGPGRRHSSRGRLLARRVHGERRADAGGESTR
jgi:Cu+-exporting ATPase